MKSKIQTSPDLIESLEENEIFVFGANEAGLHEGGAARQALNWGAKYGKGFGIQGKTFGIPTKDYNVITLPVSKIKKYVDKFIMYAKKNPEKIFLVTDIGCGLAGYKHEDIAPLFEEAIEISNIYLPRAFVAILNDE